MNTPTSLTPAQRQKIAHWLRKVADDVRQGYASDAIDQAARDVVDTYLDERRDPENQP